MRRRRPLARHYRSHVIHEEQLRLWDEREHELILLDAIAAYVNATPSARVYLTLA